MLNKIIHTLGSKLIGHIISFVLIVLTTNLFGDEGKGLVSLFVFNVSLVVMITGFIGGPTLVYLIPRYNNKHLISLSYLWAIVGTLLGGFVLYSLDLINYSWLILLLISAVLQAFASANMMVLIGKEKIKTHNIITISQVVLLLIALLVFYFLVGLKDPISYIYAYLTASAGHLLLSAYFTVVAISKNNPTASVNLKETFTLGFYNQLGNVIQLLNYRFSYYIIKNQANLGTAAVGVYSTGIQIGEALWVISRSISLVQYSFISNSDNQEKSKQLTIDLIKLNFVAVLVGIIPFILIPESMYIMIFGADFGEVKTVLIYLSVGIVSNAVSSGFSHYFAGIGKPQINTIGSSIGLVFTVLLCVTLIPVYGIIGACIASSIAYTAAYLFQFGYFLKTESVSLAQFKFTKSDFIRITNPKK